MDLTILNTDFIPQHIIDVYKSFIWTDRYSSYGDFEVYIPMSIETIRKFQQGYYLQFGNSEHAMIIENIQITTDVENGAFLIVTGRSLESILLRRIVWAQTNFAANAYIQNMVSKLLNDAIISPSIANRKISNFVFKSSSDSRISTLRTTGELQFTGDNLYDAIKKICDLYGLGFKITINDSAKFEFELYMGLDRSYAQSALPYVSFSPNFDNLINSDYKVDVANYKNVTLVAGEGEGVDRKTAVVDTLGASGLDRYELYTDARDLSTNTDSGTLTDDQYTAVLINRGRNKLTENKIESDFSAKVDYQTMYIYGRDFTMGDIVQFENEFNLQSRVRVTEFIQSDSPDNGVEQYPTFETIEED